MTANGSRAGTPPHVPADLTGVWSREIITTPGGQRDETTRVLWLQTRSWYADLRVPADRPSGRGGRGFVDFSDAELVQLAAVQGFAGELAATGDVCLWRRDLDQQPAAGPPDEARYTVNDAVMVEDGLHVEYQEIWRREPKSQAPLAAFRLTGDPLRRAGLLVVAGDHFLAFVDRTTPLGEASSLADLVQAELVLGRRERAEAMLSTNICYGRIANGWPVHLANLPWLEGSSFWTHPVAWSPTGGVLESGEQTWTLLDASTSVVELGRTLAPTGVS